MIFSDIAAVQPVRLLSNFLVLYDNAVYDAAVGCAGIQRNDSRRHVRAEIRALAKLPALSLIPAVPVGCVPMTADDGFIILIYGAHGVHAVDPARLPPAPFGRLPPIADVRESGGSVRNARYMP